MLALEVAREKDEMHENAVFIGYNGLKKAETPVRPFFGCLIAVGLKRIRPRVAALVSNASNRICSNMDEEDSGKSSGCRCTSLNLVPNLMRAVSKLMQASKAKMGPNTSVLPLV